MAYLIANDLETTAMQVIKRHGVTSLVVVEESPDWPGELIFQPADAQGFYDRYGDWTSRYLVLNQLFALDQFHQMITADGHQPVFAKSTLPILKKFDRWDAPLHIDGFTCPDGKELYPFQTFSLNRALERASNKTSPDRLFFCNWCTGSGKAQPLSEPVLTPGGWQTMGDLYVGADVIGSDGKPTRVQAIHPQGVQPVFRVEFNDGTFVRCNEEHLWTVRRRKVNSRVTRKRPNVEAPWKTLTTKEIAATLEGGRRWQLPELAPVQGDPEGNLLVDPYALGVFLGDGSWSKNHAAVSTDRWIAEMLGWKLYPSQEAKGHLYHTIAAVPSSFRHALVTMGLRGVGSHERFIPEAFLLASVGERLALLQGLLDTDGYQGGGVSTVEYSTTSPGLRDAVAELVRSLGGRATVSASRVTKYTNTTGERIPGRESWRIHLSLPQGMNPFRLPRKLDTWVRPTRYRATKTIRSIVKEEISEEQQCITVEASDNLYVTRGYALTHNSLFAMAGAQELFNRGEIDIVMAFTLMGSKINLATDAVASFAKTTTLNAVVNDGAKAKRVRGYESGADVFVCNYEKCWVDQEEISELTKGRRVLWVFDEASKVLKAHGARTRTRKGLQKLVRGSQATVWPMSASVVDASPLRYRDVYNLSGDADTRNPLGTKEEFQARYSRFGAWGAGTETDEWNRARLHEIRHRVADRTQAVRKTDPGVREYFKGMQTVLVPIHMSPEDRRLYDVITEDARTAISQTPAGESPGMRVMGHYRLLQYVCNTPEALTVSTDELAVRLQTEMPEALTAKHSAKLEVFLDQVEEIRDQGDKVVAFTHYTNLGMLLMAPHLDARGIDYVLHYGVGQSAKQRQEAQRIFKTEPKVTLFLSSDAGSHGLNLPEARYVINYDVPRSYDLLMQRSERINRADSKLDGMTSFCYVTTFPEGETCVEEEIWTENERRRMIAAATMGTVEARDYGVPVSEEQAVANIFGIKTAS